MFKFSEENVKISSSPNINLFCQCNQWIQKSLTILILLSLKNLSAHFQTSDTHQHPHKQHRLFTQIYASTRSSSDIPIPNVPQGRHVEEYLSLRRCDSVTVGWVPSHGPKTAHYCLVVKEGRIGDAEGFRWPNQCSLEHRLKKSADYYVKHCMDVKHEKE